MIACRLEKLFILPVLVCIILTLICTYWYGMKQRSGAPRMRRVFDSVVTLVMDGPYPLSRISAEYAAQPLLAAQLTWSFPAPADALLDHVLVNNMWKGGGYVPMVIVEVGTHLGSSALPMASLLKAYDMDFAIICVDLWGHLGYDTSDKVNPDWFRRSEDNFLMLASGVHHGMPGPRYQQFLSNVRHEGHEDVIVPIIGSSLPALKYLHELLNKKVPVDFIFIDASHFYNGTLREIEGSVKLLRPGGFLCGDDFQLAYADDVVRAVRDYVFAHWPGLAPQDLAHWARVSQAVKPRADGVRYTLRYDEYDADLPLHRPCDTAPATWPRYANDYY